MGRAILVPPWRSRQPPPLGQMLLPPVVARALYSIYVTYVYVSYTSFTQECKLNNEGTLFFWIVSSNGGQPRASSRWSAGEHLLPLVAGPREAPRNGDRKGSRAARSLRGAHTSSAPLSTAQSAHAPTQRPALLLCRPPFPPSACCLAPSILLTWNISSFTAPTHI